MRLARTALVAGLIACAGCQWAAPRSAGSHRDVDALDENGLRGEYDRLSARADELERADAARSLELAKSEADLESQRELNRLLRQELDATTKDLDFLESQFITLEHRLTREETRASAVASLADAQLLYEKFKKEGNDSTSADVIRDVERKLAAADDQMQRNNYAAAVYYANRATRLLNQTERQHNAFLSSGGARIVAVSSANLRQGPGAGFKVVAHLTYGTVLVEVAQKEDWLQVKTRDGTQGWIHHTLLY